MMKPQIINDDVRTDYEIKDIWTNLVLERNHILTYCIAASAITYEKESC